MNLNLIQNLSDSTLTLIYILIVILLALIATKIIAKLLEKFVKYNSTIIYLINDIINYIIYFIAIMIILQYFGINLAATLLSLGIIGIAVSLAAKDLFGNLISGIVLILHQSIKVGDTIEVNHIKGTVTRIFLRTTLIIDDDGIKHHVPNSKLTNDGYLEYKPQEKYRVDILIQVPMNIDLKTFEEFILPKINAYDDVFDEPPARILSKGITENWVNLKISFWIKNINNKDTYRLIITDEIRKFLNSGEKNE